MSKPVFNLPVPVSGQTTKQLLDNEVNRIVTSIWAALLANSDEAVVDALVAQINLIRDEAIDGTSADALATAADRIQTALDVVAAQAARDAAFVSADVYPDIATGRAAVADGVQFQVVSGDEVIRYRRDSSSTQTEVARYPSAQFVNEQAAALRAETVARLTDVSRGAADGDARGLAVLDERGFVGAEIGGSYTYLNGIETEVVEGNILRRKTDAAVLDEILILDSQTPEAVVDVRGFIGWGIDEAGQIIGVPNLITSKDIPSISVDSLRRVRTKLGLLKGARTAQIDIGYFGDSFVDGQSRFLSELTRILCADWGDAGGGWTGFAWGSAGTTSRGNARGASSLNEYTVSSLSQTGGWTRSNRDGGDPSLGHVETSTAGSFIDLAGPATEQFSLSYEAVIAGTIRYSWDGGSTWTSLILDAGVGYRSVELVGGPVGAFTLRIEHVSGTSRLYGVFYRNTASGIRMSKYGNNGSHSGEWAAASVLWDESIAALPLDLAVITLGTNDQNSSNNISPSEMAGNLAVMVNRLRAAKPAVDVLIVMPPENLGGRITPMMEYAASVGAWCIANNIGWINMQPFFGDDPAEYAADGPIPLWNPDNIHVGSVVSGQPGGALWARIISETIFSK